ncbi:MAG: hypothetical protein KHW59_08885, partial [Clostridiales bacterium]|nr:hypothetical protein [Clostridiales bacterium]
MKKNGWKKRGLALLLSVSMLISAIPVTVSAAEAEPVQTLEAGTQEEKEPVRIVGEVPELRGPDEKHFRLSDGSMAAAKYPDAVHYDTGDGWAEIDNSLALEKTADPVYSNQENAFKVSFAESADADELVRLEQDGYALSWSYEKNEPEHPALSPFSAVIPQMAPARAQVMEKEEIPAEDTAEKTADVTAESVPGAAVEGAESGVLPADDPALQVENASSGIVYENIQPGVDLQYILTGSQLKENLILEKPMDTYAFTLHLRAEGLTAALEEDGSIAFTPAVGGEAVFTIPAPVLYDSAGAVSDMASYSLEETETGYDLTVTADESWMDAAERVYPVTIDPVVLT